MNTAGNVDYFFEHRLIYTVEVRQAALFNSQSSSNGNAEQQFHTVGFLPENRDVERPVVNFVKLAHRRREIQLLTS